MLMRILIWFSILGMVLVFPGISFSAGGCLHSPGEYRLSADYQCLGRWTQTVDIEGSASEVVCVGTDTRPIDLWLESRASLDESVTPARLRHSACAAFWRQRGWKDVRLFLSSTTQGEISSEFTHAGDVYGRRP